MNSLTYGNSSTFNVSVTTSTPYLDTGYYDSLGCFHPYVYYPYVSYPTYSWSYPVKVYMYQIECPRCKTRNWCELDQTTTCTKCSSTLKAVSKKVDYEIPVK